jgi:hypothetical protein
MVSNKTETKSIGHMNGMYLTLDKCAGTPFGIANDFDDLHLRMLGKMLRKHTGQLRVIDVGG